MHSGTHRILVLLAAFSAGLLHAAAPCAPGLNGSRTLWAAADFDGDHSLDLVRLRLSRTLTQPAPGLVCPSALPSVLGAFPRHGLVLSASDVDSDLDQDLVLRDSWAGKPVQVWLNDGTGQFSPADIALFAWAGHPPPSIETVPSSPLTFEVSSSASPCLPTPGAAHLDEPESAWRCSPTPVPPSPWRSNARGRAPPSSC